MNVLSIDVAITKPTAYALFRDEKLSRYDKVPGIPGIEELLIACHDIDYIDIDLIVTENMYHGKNIGTLKKLCYEVGKVIYIADLHGIKYKLVRSVDWMSHHGLTNMTPAMSVYLPKKIILHETGFEADDDDIQAAILIGLYVIERARLGMK